MRSQSPLLLAPTPAPSPSPSPTPIHLTLTRYEITGGYIRNAVLAALLSAVSTLPLTSYPLLANPNPNP